MDELKQLAVNLLLWLCLAAPGLVLLAWLWRRGRDWRVLLPPQRSRAVPWSGFELLVVFLACEVLWPAVGFSVLELLFGAAPEQESYLRIPQTMAVVFPFQVATVFLTLPLLSGTRPYQLGITTNYLGRNLLLGYLGWVVLFPVVYLVEFLVVVCYQYRTGEVPTPHDLKKLVEGEEPEWLLVGFLAVVAAPVLEELLFRGVVLLWLPTRPWGSQAAMSAAVALPLARFPETGPGALLFAVALLPGYFLLPQLLRPWLEPPPSPWPEDTPEAFAESSSPPLPRTADETRYERTLANARAVYATSAVWCLSHRNWPDPIPLFVLGLGLGWLAYRTRSLVGPMLLHALFNACSCLILWLSALKIL